jgi:hypothetical protein
LNRLKLGDDHDARGRLLDYVDDYGFFGGSGRLSRRLDRLRSNFLGAARFARGLVVRFLAFVLRPARLATFLRVDLTRARAFPRFAAVFFRPNARLFRFAMCLSAS